MLKKTLLITCLLITFSVALEVAAQSTSGLKITSFTIDGGGGNSTGGNFNLNGTIGQPDAGISSGETYTLQGGFWGNFDGTDQHMLTTMVIVLASTIANTYWSNKMFKQTAIDNALAISRALGQNFLKIILKDSTDIAADTTAALKAFSDINDMYLYNSNGQAIFQYHHRDYSQIKNPPKIKRRQSIEFHGNALAGLET